MTGLLVLALFAAAARPAPVAPPDPPPIVRRLIGPDGVEPGDYAFLRGRFPGASAAEMADWQVIDGWIRRCRRQATAAVRAQVESLGASSAHLHEYAYADEPCAGIDALIRVADGFADWTTFQAALGRARPVAATYLHATAKAEEVARAFSDEPTMGQRFRARTVGEQVLRLGIIAWAPGNSDKAPAAIDPAAAGIVRVLLRRAIAERDHANTAWLKSVVDRHGWPKLSVAGADGAGAAWLVVQHADDDPAFQLRALRLMEPMVAAREVRPDQYALLYDRVMLKIAGTQRYATQFTCTDHVYGPYDLEDPAGVDRRRASVGLDSLAEYRERMIRLYGVHCE